MISACRAARRALISKGADPSDQHWPLAVFHGNVSGLIFRPQRRSDGDAVAQRGFFRKRRDPTSTADRWSRADRWPPRLPSQASWHTVGRSRLRPRQVPPQAALARDQAADRPPQERTRLRARQEALGHRVRLRLAAQLPSAANQNERFAETHLAFMLLDCTVICWRMLRWPEELLA